MEFVSPRRDRLKSQLVEEGLDALLITNPVNVTYLTGFSGESSVLLVSRERDLLISDARFTEQLAEECPGLPTHIRPPTKRPLETIAEILQQLGVRQIGVESSAITLAEAESLRQLVPAGSWKGSTNRVEQLRMVKDPSEVEQIREAIAIAERAYAAFVALLRPTDTEKDLCDAMEQFVRRCGGRSTCFPSIIAVGARAALPHAPPTHQPVSAGEMLLVDWGVSGPFYKSDLTRVLDTRRRNSFFPEASARPPAGLLEKVHTVVCQAQRAALGAIRPGVPAREIDQAARQVIAEAGYGDYFGHGLGHGLGLQVHEGPAIRPGSETVLQPGMVFTVEPGIYLPGQLGVRIEDDVLVTEEGCVVLSHVSRDLQPVFATSA